MVSSGLLVAVTGLVGNADYEGSWRTDSNWGAAYRWRMPISDWSNGGVKSVLGVPVFDGASGLGHRLPNFAGTNHGSFLILLHRWVPAHVLTLAWLWIAMTLCWVTIDLVAQSWNGRNRFFVRLWVTSFLAGILFAYGLNTDWLLALAGLFGTLSTAASLYHRGLWEGSQPHVASSSEAFALLAGSLLLVMSAHPVSVLLVGPILILRLSVIRFFLVLPTSRFTILLIFGSLLFISGVLAYELYSLRLPSGAVRPPAPNTFDFLIQGWGLGDWRQFLRTTALNSALPIFLISKQIGLTDWFGWQYEFLNYSALICLAMTILVTRRTEGLADVRRRAGRSCLIVVFALMVAMTLTSELGVLKYPLRLFLYSDGAGLQPVAALLILVGCILARPGGAFDGERARLLRGVYKTSVVLAIVLAFVFPVILLVSAPTLNGSQKRDLFSRDTEGVTRVDSIRGRLGDLARDKDAGCIPTSGYLENLGVSHPLVASRSGLPTIESNAAYQSRGVSVSEDRYTQYCDVWENWGDCNSQTLDFLSLGVVLAHPDNSQCEWLSLVPTIRELAKSRNSQSDLYQRDRYANFYVPNDDLTNTSEDLCVIRHDCLSKVRRTTVSQPQPPWILCRSGCWFQYDVLQRRNPSLEWLVIPARFDPAVSLRDVQTSQQLKVTSYRGLLAVNVGTEGMAQTLEASVEPDHRMFLIALVPYFSLGVFVSVGLVVFRSRRRCPP